jgi:ketosteroid isomerase-like protein
LTGNASNYEDDESKVLAIEREIMAAIRNKDAAALEPMLGEDFCYRTHFGAEADKEGFLKSITTTPFEIISLHGEELNVDIYGDTAILTGVQIAEARPPEGEKEQSVVAFTDVFVRRSGGWVMVLAYGVELPSDSDAGPN